MARLEDLGEIISTDVLVVGGGVAGLVAAIKAKESPVDVLVVEKQTIGWSGKVPRGHGGILLLAPDDDVDKLIEFHTRNIGYYLNDQDLFRKLFEGTFATFEQMVDWGVWVRRDEQGKPYIGKHRTGLVSWFATDINMLIQLRAKARKTGVKMLNKIQIVDLLKQGNRVVGAVGFNLIDGRFYVIKAKATILANGGCNFRAERKWSSGYGDSVAAAYRAGAEMRNAEFSNFYEIHSKVTGDENIAGMRVAKNFIFNVKGENLFQKYHGNPDFDISPEYVMALDREITGGQGPFYLDTSLLVPNPNVPPPKAKRLERRVEAKEHKYAPLPSAKPEVRLAFYAEMTPVKVDHGMKTTLEGLWAIGDTSQEGSAWAGAIFSPRTGLGRTGLMYAAVTGMWAGPSASGFAIETNTPGISYDYVSKLKEEIFAPTKLKKGLSPSDAIFAVQQVICPVKYNLRRAKDRLEEALAKLDDLKQKLPELWARDSHGLGKCHEVRSMALCAEMALRFALKRTESRGWHYREDYPQRDDKNWLKWITAKQTGNKMTLSTEPVPIGKYKFKPG